jgi:type III secretion system FlhB-like substrate exporter
MKMSKKKVEKAVAVRYNLSMPAPIIVAKGKGELTQKIKDIAKEHNIKIINKPDLADSLVELDVGSLIPEAYYEIMAEILVFVKNLGSKL